ncbi:hypothetical protein THAOC_34794, partial [Thalassiosira oceanica]
EAAASRDDLAREMGCTSRVDHAGKFSSIALEGGPSARNGGRQSKEHDEAVSEHRSVLNSDDEDFQVESSCFNPMRQSAVWKWDERGL